MALRHLCNNDEGDLRQALIDVANSLEDLGVDGDVTITITNNGDIRADLDLDTETKMICSITDDGNDYRTRYVKNDVAR